MDRSSDIVSDLKFNEMLTEAIQQLKLTLNKPHENDLITLLNSTIDYIIQLELLREAKGRTER